MLKFTIRDIVKDRDEGRDMLHRVTKTCVHCEMKGDWHSLMLCKKHCAYYNGCHLDNDGELAVECTYTKESESSLTNLLSTDPEGE